MKVEKFIMLSKMRNYSAQLSIAAVCIILGFAFTLQVKSVVYNKKTLEPSYANMSEVMDELIKEKNKNELLHRQIEEYKKDLEEIHDQGKETSGAYAIMARDLERAEVLAGLVDVEGPGIIFTLNDGQGTGISRWEENIHDTDLLVAINELRDGGAEALSINGHRLLSTSEVRCAGTVVSVNNTRISAPFEIKAIGDPAKLEASLRMRGGIYDVLNAYGLDISIKRSTSIKIEKYDGVLKFDHATRGDV